MTQQTISRELVFSERFGMAEQSILTEEATDFLAELVNRFLLPRNGLLLERQLQQQKIDAGELPDFISETASIRNADWKIRSIPEELQDRRVEIHRVC